MTRDSRHFTLWSVQSQYVWERLSTAGVLYAHKPRRDKMWMPAFEWMAEQVRLRCDVSQAKWPWWAWHSYNGFEHPRSRHIGLRRSSLRRDGVILTLRVPLSLVVLSDYDSWHLVLGDNCIEYDRAGRKYRTQQSKRESWSRVIIDQKSLLRWRSRSNVFIQAAIPMLRLEWVVDCQPVVRGMGGGSDR